MNAENYSELSEADSELGAITEFIAKRFRGGKRLPDLLVDGGEGGPLKARSREFGGLKAMQKRLLSAP